MPSLAGLIPIAVCMLIADLMAPLAVRFDPLLRYGASTDIGLVEALETCSEPASLELLDMPGVCGR